MLLHPPPVVRPSGTTNRACREFPPFWLFRSFSARRAAWEQFGILRGVNFWGMREFILLRDGPPLPNGPNLQNWKLYLGVSRAELKLKVIDLSMLEITFFLE